MPTDPSHARLRLRNLIAGLVASTATPSAPRAIAVAGLGVNPTIDDLLATLDTDEADDLAVVLAALDEYGVIADAICAGSALVPRFVYVAKGHDWRTGAARGLSVVDLIGVDRENAKADLVANVAEDVKARTIVATMNSHPPVGAPPAGYDEEPF